MDDGPLVCPVYACHRCVDFSTHPNRERRRTRKPYFGDRRIIGRKVTSVFNLMAETQPPEPKIALILDDQEALKKSAANPGPTQIPLTAPRLTGSQLTASQQIQ